MAEAHGSHGAGFRQGDDRRRLSSDDDIFSPRRARRHADRADRIGIESLARSVHRRLARSRTCRAARRNRALCWGAPLCAAKPTRRDARGAKSSTEMDQAKCFKFKYLKWCMNGEL